MIFHFSLNQYRSLSIWILWWASSKHCKLLAARPYFSHCQLYVCFSSVGNGKSHFILAPNVKTSNIVYPEALCQYKLIYVCKIHYCKCITSTLMQIFMDKLLLSWITWLPVAFPQESDVLATQKKCSYMITILVSCVQSKWRPLT
jgi:hypothetical protein